MLFVVLPLLQRYVPPEMVLLEVSVVLDPVQKLFVPLIVGVAMDVVCVTINPVELAD
jgi:hypothetical protein